MSIESKIKQNIPLAPLTTFKIGGPAEYFVEIKTKEELVEAASWAKENKKPLVILAGGSNVLINDQGIKGLVIKMGNNNLAVKGERVECEAGAELSQVVRLAAGHNLSGLEWAAGIPGSVGGAIRGNAGAFGQSMAEAIETVEVYKIKKSKFYLFSHNECSFRYRQSIFKKNKNLLIWLVVLKLHKGDVRDINEKITENLNKRNKSQPKLPSAGCIFKNIDFKDLEQINPNLAKDARGENIIKGEKVSVGWVISRLNLAGKKIGKAKISLEHANFIVNINKATAEEVIILISFIKQQVRDKTGLQLHEEIQYFGFD